MALSVHGTAPDSGHHFRTARNSHQVIADDFLSMPALDDGIHADVIDFRVVAISSNTFKHAYFAREVRPVPFGATFWTRLTWPNPAVTTLYTPLLLLAVSFMVDPSISEVMEWFAPPGWVILSV